MPWLRAGLCWPGSAGVGRPAVNLPSKGGGGVRRWCRLECPGRNCPRPTARAKQSALSQNGYGWTTLIDPGSFFGPGRPKVSHLFAAQGAKPSLSRPAWRRFRALAVALVQPPPPCLFVVSVDGPTTRRTKLAFPGARSWSAARRAATKHSAALPFAAALIAQLGERPTEDLKVPGSIPGLGTALRPNWHNAENRFPRGVQ